MAELYQSKPDYTVPITNDSNTKTNRREQLERINRLFHLPEIEYRLSEGAHGRPPVSTSYFFPETRIGIMRSDWSGQARYLFFDMGRWGDNHMNEDQLNIEVSAYGRKFLVNSGRWRYTTSPNAPWMPWAKYFKTTAAYNSVLVDGYNQVAADANGIMKIHPDYDYAEGWFEAGYGEEASEADEKLLKEKGVMHNKICRVHGVTHTRKIIFVKPDFWILRDTIVGKGEHEAEQIWHFYEGDLKPDQSGRFMVTGFDDANLIIGTFGDSNVTKNIFKGSENPIRGWHCPYYDQLRPAPELAYRQRNRDRIIFHTLIFPVKGRVNEMPVFEVTEFGYRVSYQGRKWEIAAPESGAWKLL